MTTISPSCLAVVAYSSAGCSLAPRGAALSFADAGVATHAMMPSTAPPLSRRILALEKSTIDILPMASRIQAVRLPRFSAQSKIERKDRLQNSRFKRPFLKVISILTKARPSNN
ncbi:hypothetical protein [Novosphingobium sp. BL-52-GroH]|uniref:hypothetical protein n=1 Tax=Novosphingobium sp. BL-52-GroH TaxID=3349877 RepID=UPI00384F340A